MVFCSCNIVFSIPPILSNYDCWNSIAILSSIMHLQFKCPYTPIKGRSKYVVILFNNFYPLLGLITIHLIDFILFQVKGMTHLWIHPFSSHASVRFSYLVFLHSCIMHLCISAIVVYIFCIK